MPIVAGWAVYIHGSQGLKALTEKLPIWTFNLLSDYYYFFPFYNYYHDFNPVQHEIINIQMNRFKHIYYSMNYIIKSEFGKMLIEMMLFYFIKFHFFLIINEILDDRWNVGKEWILDSSNWLIWYLLTPADAVLGCRDDGRIFDFNITLDILVHRRVDF